MPSAHCVSTIDGIILAIDRGFLDLVRMPEHEVVGISYKDITHPDDLGRSADMLVSLVERAPPLRMQKRYRRPDGTSVTANLYVTRFSDPDRLVSTLFWNDAGREMPPARLWSIALQLRRLHDTRKAEFGHEFATDPVGLILNCIYLAEAEGRVVNLSAISADTDIPSSLVYRWVALLTQHGLLETCSKPEKNVQFTHEGMQKMERILASGHEISISE